MKEKEDVCVCTNIVRGKKILKGKNTAAHKVRICSSIVNVTDREIGTRIIDLFLDTQFFAMELKHIQNFISRMFYSVCAPVERRKEYKREVEIFFFFENYISRG